MPALPTTRLSSLLPLVLPFAKHCPEPFALLQARLAAIEFCEKTRCWRHVATVEMVANHTAFVAPTHSTIFEFEDATFDGNPLAAIQYTEATPDELAEIAGSGRPKWLTQISPGEVAVYPFEPGTLRLSMFLKPRHGQLFSTDPDDPLHDAYNVIPDFLFQQHANALADGALARILMCEGEPFFNPQKAAVHDARFGEACGRRSSSHVRSQQRAPIRTKPRWL
jgi:hypothetical protein